jgi:hypothetical protein
VENWETGTKRPSELAIKMLAVVRKHGLAVLDQAAGRGGAFPPRQAALGTASHLSYSKGQIERE